MTHQTDLPASGGPSASARPCTPLRIRAMVEEPRPHEASWRCELRATHSARRGRLTAVLPPQLVARIEAQTGHPLRPDDLIGEHVVELTVTVAPDGDLLGWIEDLHLDLAHDDVVRARAERDDAIRSRLSADGLMATQGTRPQIDRLRRVAMIEPQDGRPREASVRLADWEARGLLTLLRFPVAFEGPQAVVDLHHTLDGAYDQYEWGTLDALIVVLDGVRDLDALADEELLRRLCVFPVPILVVRPDRPTVLCDLAHLTVDGAAELIAHLEAILQRELRLAGFPRLAAIAQALLSAAPTLRQVPLSES